jgi:excisionase family DNA binding protein
MAQTSTDDNRATWKVDEAAKYMGCGNKALRDAIRDGRVPAIFMGRNILIPRTAFLRWLDNAGKI